ncbi:MULTISPECIES: cutinase family protein [unclassified Mycobacterium]|uniref:cutinase family protein n=2 Tax=Mycobacterium TaxID=1763 RepID=UPI0007FBB8E3|nr:cutinase [Mycobacterium sp. E735]OBG55186.1 cutinase [Mycobacterium sp. E188]OBG81071.1 cutinase [Mycobacterium sp. E3305]OBG82490.1 cutinase [Mycobacterium sp. E3298]OBH31700.1 cutinase [Mycobacterium sp. E1715]OBH37901.1 cutinase [Mycobacterium sp. E183]
MRLVASVPSVVIVAGAMALGPAAAPLPISSVPLASAACPDAEVVFARGREEPPGVGAVGDALVNSLRAKTNKSIGVYGVNYPANITTGGGANDISAHVQAMARDCPNTRIVLGGYSLGAEVVDRALWGGLPPGTDRHVAAVALFGNGTHGVGPAFAGKTIDQCAAGDPICGRGTSWPAHLQPSYIGSGLVDQAAGFVAGRL